MGSFEKTYLKKPLVSTYTICRMKILEVIFFFIVFTESHELLAPCDDDDDIEIHKEEFSGMQLMKMFYDSVGVLLNLPDEALTATDEHNANHSPIYSKIGAPHVSGKSQAWCAKVGEPNEIMVDLTTSMLVTGVATQGRGDRSTQWVPKYSIDTSENGYDWIDHGTFGGNFDSDTICRSRLKYPVPARYVKLSVLDYKDHPCLRWDVLTYNKF